MAPEAYQPNQLDEITSLNSELVEETDNRDEKIADSADRSSREIAELNSDPKLAKQEADKIVEWLPSSIDQLSPLQQEMFINSVERSIIENNLDILPDIIPDIIPDNWKKQLDNYKNLDRSRLTPDQQADLNSVEKEAIMDMTKETESLLNTDKVSE